MALGNFGQGGGFEEWSQNIHDIMDEMLRRECCERTRIRIRGRRAQPRPDGVEGPLSVHAMEIDEGPFSREIDLPEPIDMDQIEARIFASMSDDAGLTDAFRTADTTGGDFFVEIAKQVYREPDFQKSDKRRTLVKSMVYGRLYGAGAAKMAETAGVPVARMQVIAEAMDTAYPGMAAFMKQIESDGWERQKKEGQGYVVTPLGRRLPADENRLYALVNYGIQSAAADVLKQGLVRLDAAGYDSFMVLPVHDEVLVDIPKEYADQALRDIPLLMQDLNYSVPLTAGADGPFDRWGDRY